MKWTQEEITTIDNVLRNWADDVEEPDLSPNGLRLGNIGDSNQIALRNRIVFAISKLSDGDMSPRNVAHAARAAFPCEALKFQL